MIRMVVVIITIFRPAVKRWLKSKEALLRLPSLALMICVSLSQEVSSVSYSLKASIK